jgi:hypothetical protein
MKEATFVGPLRRPTYDEICLGCVCDIVHLRTVLLSSLIK